MYRYVSIHKSRDSVTWMCRGEKCAVMNTVKRRRGQLSPSPHITSQPDETQMGSANGAGHHPLAWPLSAWWPPALGSACILPGRLCHRFPHLEQMLLPPPAAGKLWKLWLRQLSSTKLEAKLVLHDIPICEICHRLWYHVTASKGILACKNWGGEGLPCGVQWLPLCNC